MCPFFPFSMGCKYRGKHVSLKKHIYILEKQEKNPIQNREPGKTVQRIV